MLTSRGRSAHDTELRTDGIDAFFAPGAVAVVGASRRPGKLGHEVLRAAAERGFAGRMYGVNPLGERKELHGWPVVHRLEEIGEPVDLVLVAVPAAATLEAVAQAARLGVRAAVLAASGLGELDTEGAERQAEIGRVGAVAGTRLLGPNGFGLFVAEAGLNLTTWQQIPTGRVALVTQSGNVAIALFRQLAYAGIGLSSCAGLGNQLDVNAADLLAFHAGSASCDAVACYLEGLPPGSGRALREALGACKAAGKPVVVLKGGRSRAGAGAAATHTGALGGDDRLWNAVLDEEGAHRAESPEEMVDLLSVLTRVPPSPGRALVLTDGGGDSVLAVDALSAAGVPLATLAASTRDALDRLSPPAAPRVAGRNPVTLDTAGGLEDDPGLLGRCAAAGAADPGVDVLVVSGTFGGYRHQRRQELDGVELLLALSGGGTPVVVHSAFAFDDEEPLERLRSGGVPVFPTAHRLARALAAARRTSEVPAATAGTDRAAAAAPREGAAPLAAAGSAPSGAPSWLLGVKEAAELASSAGVVLPDLVLVADEDELRAAAVEIGFPLCLKVEDPAISHKSDVGGVRLGLGPDAYLKAAAELWGRFSEASLLVMPMLEPGLELLVGAAQDPTFGPFLIVGRGGVTAELDPDLAVVTAPVDLPAARAAWRSLRIAPLLDGWRGRAAVDLEALSRLAVSLSELAVADRRLSIECNPVIAYPSGYGVADLRAVRS